MIESGVIWPNRFATIAEYCLKHESVNCWGLVWECGGVGARWRAKCGPMFAELLYGHLPFAIQWSSIKFWYDIWVWYQWFCVWCSPWRPVTDSQRSVSSFPWLSCIARDIKFPPLLRVTLDITSATTDSYLFAYYAVLQRRVSSIGWGLGNGNKINLQNHDNSQPAPCIIDGALVKWHINSTVCSWLLY